MATRRRRNAPRSPSRRRSGRSQRARVTALSEREQAAYQRALHALKKVRPTGGNLSLREAAKHAGTSPATVRKYVGAALVQASNRRYHATRSDHLYRALQMQTTDGPVTIHTTSSRTASLIAKHSSAIGHYATTGDDESLKMFAGQRITSGGQTYRFLTSTLEIEELLNAGALDFEGLYKTPQ